MRQNETTAPDSTEEHRAISRIPAIDGLRGVALTLVVLFHLFGQGHVSGGVDVFLFVSGFLLTVSLGRSLARGRPLDIVRRWSRTFSRLAPPAALVLLAVLAASFTLLPDRHLVQNLAEIASSAAYAENWQLMFSQLAYGAAGPETSPLQHFWSLSVQGQVFLVLPLIAAACLLLRTPRARARAFWILLAALTAASFAYAWRENRVDWAAAYFSTFTRFWELGLGGLVAGAHLAGWRVPPRIASVAGWVGLSVIVASGFAIDGARAFPGPLALVPLAGAALVLTSSHTSAGWSATRVLSSPALGALDRLSYPLYLWHWPVLIVFLTVTRQQVSELGVDGAVIVVAVSVALSLATRAVLSRPIDWAAAARRRGIAVALIAILLPAVPATALHLDARADAGAEVALDPCAGAAALDPDRPECQDYEGDGALQPALATIVDDDALRGECWSSRWDGDMKVCGLGPEDAEVRLFAVGDSHTGVLIDAYERIAERNGWHIDLASRYSCTWTDMEVPPADRPEGEQTQCREWREQVRGHLAESSYDAILVSNSSKSPVDVPEGVDEVEFRADALQSAWEQRPEGTPLIAIRDNPIFPVEMMDCLENDEAALAGECALPRDEALLDDGTALAVERDPHAELVDVTDYQCGPDTCDMLVGGVYVVRDGSHMTRTFVDTLEPYLERELTAILAG